MRQDKTRSEHRLETIRLALDADGNGNAEPLTAGPMFERDLFGRRGDALVNGTVDPMGWFEPIGALTKKALTVIA